MAKIPAIRVPFRDIQKVKKKLILNSLFNNSYELLKTKANAFIPIKSRSRVKRIFRYPIFEKELKKIKTDTGLRDALSSKLTREEMNSLKTAYDIVGNIAILEIDEILRPRARLIAETLLKSNSAIKTVLKKEGAHAGECRTQGMKWLAGIKTKEALHRENNVSLKLDVEKVYFSPRLATERKRIMQQVKEGEDILVMFSGCGPYPCVLSKNTKARHIFGIEINPIGHKYGMENIRLNKLHNVTLINGDARKVVKKIFHYIVGLKSSDKEYEMHTRLIHHPVIMEIHLFEDDLYKNKPKLEKTIRELQEKGIHVKLHMPFKHNGKPFSLGQKNVREELKMLKILGELCRKYNLKAVVHPTQQVGIAEDEDMLVENLKKLKKYYDFFYFENVTHGIFSKANDIVRVGEKAGLKNMTIDTCHLFIVYQNMDKIERHIKKIRKHFNTYFHLNDHDYKTHSCEIGKGYIDFNRILPYVNIGVTEVCSKDERHPVEMINSFIKVEHRLRKFDRILMPLPKSAEEFLPSALLAAKKGTIIHFYDFLHEDEFKTAHDKITDACRKANLKFRILRTVKCGQHAPHIFRICVDLKIL